MTSKLSDRAYSDLLDVERTLLALSEDLAGLIATPANQRDAPAIRAGWAAMREHQRRLTLVTKRLEALEVPDRKAMGWAEYKRAKRVYEHARLSRRRLRDWDRVTKMVIAHTEPFRETLIDWEALAPEDELFKFLDVGFHRALKPRKQEEDAKELKCYPDIAYPARKFDQLVAAAYRLLLVQGRAHGGRFLDVGCGAGSRVYLANRFFRYCDGLEYDAGYVEAAERFLGIFDESDFDVIHANGITFEGYGKYDAIYFYRPMRDDEVLAQLERQIYTCARQGTVILAPYDENLVYRQLNRDIDIAVVEGPILIAGVSQKEADEMHRAALHTSAHAVASLDDWPYDPGFWAPLIQASSHAISSV